MGLLKQKIDTEQGARDLLSLASVIINYEHSEGSVAAKKKGMRLSMLDNLMERSGHLIQHRHFKMYERLHLRYLDFTMRQLLWKGTLYDPTIYRAFVENTNGPSKILYENSPNEALILSSISRIMNQTEWTGDLTRRLAKQESLKYAHSGQSVMEVILKVVIYYYAVIGSRALYVDSLIYLLVPLINVFSNF